MEYFAFGETFIEEHKNSHNSPYKFNGKELDEESGYTYYGARYLDMRYSIWISTDPLSGYNPIMEDEHYIDGEHNGGVSNSFNLATYSYCYQNPIRYVDPTGKQSDNVKPKVVNVYIPEAVWPNVYKTHLMGIAKGNPTLLTYDSDRSAARLRRAEAQKANGGQRIPQQHLDEFPYASTKEGGAKAAVNSTPAKENMSHGGYIGSLVVTNKMKTGDKFNIILIPKPKPKQPVYEPEPVPSPQIYIPVPNPEAVKKAAPVVTVGTVLLIIGAILLSPVGI